MQGTSLTLGFSALLNDTSTCTKKTATSVFCASRFLQPIFKFTVDLVLKVRTSACGGRLAGWMGQANTGEHRLYPVLNPNNDLFPDLTK